MNLVLQAGGFGLVAFDLADVHATALRQFPYTTWMRIARVIEGSQTRRAVAPSRSRAVPAAYDRARQPAAARPWRAARTAHVVRGSMCGHAWWRGYGGDGDRGGGHGDGDGETRERTEARDKLDRRHEGAEIYWFARVRVMASPRVGARLTWGTERLQRLFAVSGRMLPRPAHARRVAVRSEIKSAVCTIPSYDDLTPSIPDITPGETFAHVQTDSAAGTTGRRGRDPLRTCAAPLSSSSSCLLIDACRPARTRSSRSRGIFRRASSATDRPAWSLDVGGLGRLLGDAHAIGAELARAAASHSLDLRIAVARTQTAARLLAIGMPRPDGARLATSRRQ